MMSNRISRERIADVLVDPREDLDREFKGWLDFKNESRDKATFAKAAIALANHGGGFIVLGFKEENGILIADQDRPKTLAQYSQDMVNGIVQKYCDPCFHCTVYQENNPDGAVFPVISIPGGHRVPVRARRGSSDKTLQVNTVYIRKSGPRSEHPDSAQDWDALLGRCLGNRRDELLDQIRNLLAGTVPQVDPPEIQSRLEQWIEASTSRWRKLSGELPDEAGARFIHGSYNFAYEIVGKLRPISLARLQGVLRESVVRYTGWPPFWYPTREGIEPYPKDNTVECWLGNDPRAAPDVSRSDFWRISPDGLAFLLRGYQEDGADAHKAGRTDLEPGTILDIAIPIWRVGETLLQAERLAANFSDEPTTIRFVAKYTGLDGRFLDSFDFSRPVLAHQASQQESIELSTYVETQAIAPNLPEIVHPFLSPLYELFGFFELPMQLVAEELTKMRRYRIRN